MGPSAGRSFLRTVLVALTGWAITAGIALLAAALPEFAAFMIGAAACMLFPVAVSVLHNYAWWLAVLSLVPGAAVLFGGVYWEQEGMGWAIGGAVGWTLIVGYAGRRGHRRRRRGKTGSPLGAVIDMQQGSW